MRSSHFRTVALLTIVAFLLPLAACAEDDTPQSARIKEIDARLDEIRAELAKPSTDEDTKEKLTDERMELNAERTNIVQGADKNRSAPDE